MALHLIAEEKTLKFGSGESWGRGMGIENSQGSEMWLSTETLLNAE